MKTAKRIVTLLICLSLYLTLCAAGFAVQENEPAEVTNAKLADAMHDLGLFMGVGENEDGTVNYDLDRAPTRIEALVMLIRMLGKEAKAVRHGRTHDFTDVPTWADGYVSYAVENGLTKGVSETLFDSDSEIMPVMFMTFLLRALGYSDGENGDFVWNDPYSLAVMLRIDNRHESITRADAMKMSACALFANSKGVTAPLYEKLISEGAFTAEAFKSAALAELLDGASTESLASNPKKFDSYDEGFECAKNYQNFAHLDSTIEEMEETDDYTLIITRPAVSGPETTCYYMTVICKAGSPLGEGTVMHLPCQTSGFLGGIRKPDTVSFSEDGTSLVYTFIFIGNRYLDSEHVLCEEGTFTYTTKLTTGITAVSHSK